MSDTNRFQGRLGNTALGLMLLDTTRRGLEFPSLSQLCEDLLEVPQCIQLGPVSACALQQVSKTGRRAKR